MTGAEREISPAYVRLSGEVAGQAILDSLRAAYPKAKIVHAFASTEAGLGFEVDDGRAGFPADVTTRLDGPMVRVRDGMLQIRSLRNAAGVLARGLRRIADEDGFVDTGDLVALRDGRYYFVGRKDGVINVGGQKVHPEEVEEVINAHPLVQMSLVTARPSPITGAVVCAGIVCRDGQAPAMLPDAIRAWCRARLPPHKVPATVRVLAKLDIAATGKLVRLSA